MAKKRKNSNYVTEKTIKREQDRILAAKIKLRNKIISWVLIITSILLSFTVMIGALGNKNGWWEDDLVVTHEVTITVSGFGTDEVGTLKFELYGENAPMAVNRFITLCTQGAYTNKTFHSFMSDMLEGGDPMANGKGSNGTYIPIEANNGVHHRKGTLSYKPVDSRGASTTFFITTKNQLELDNTCTAFGRLVSGYAILDAICEYMEEQDQSNGCVAKDLQPIIKNISVKAITREPK